MNVTVNGSVISQDITVGTYIRIFTFNCNTLLLASEFPSVFELDRAAEAAIQQFTINVKKQIEVFKEEIRDRQKGLKQLEDAGGTNES